MLLSERPQGVYLERAKRARKSHRRRRGGWRILVCLAQGGVGCGRGAWGAGGGGVGAHDARARVVCASRTEARDFGETPANRWRTTNHVP